MKAEDSVLSPSRFGRWPFGQRMYVRIQDLDDRFHRWEVLGQDLARSARNHLVVAREAIEEVLRHPILYLFRRASTVDSVLTSYNVAYCNLLRLAPIDKLSALMPDCVALVREQLPVDDPRRVDIDAIFKTLSDAHRTLAESQRKHVVAAVRGALDRSEREHVRLRTFRYWVYVLGAILVVLAGGLAVAMHFLTRTLKPQFSYLLLAGVGLASAAVAAVFSLRNLKGTSTPYDDSALALAVLKLPAGAVTAMLGVVFLSADMVGGGSPKNQWAFLAWPIVFGYSQELSTGLIDRQAQSVLNSVRTSIPLQPPQAA